MKYGIISMYIFLMGCLIGIYYTYDIKYNDILKQVNTKLSDGNYNDEVIKLENEYDILIEKLEQLSDIKVTKNDDIKLLNDNLDNMYQELVIKNEDLNSKKNILTNQYNVLVNQYNDLKEEERKRNV